MNRCSLRAAGSRTWLLALLLSSIPLNTAFVGQVAASDGPPLAQESTDSADPPEETREETPDPTLSGSEQRRANDKGGVFRPSEDISEDLAVTFPVDI